MPATEESSAESPASPSNPASAVALVTGASRGIGREVAVALAREGLALGLTARDGDALAKVREECVAAGGQAVVAVAEVTSRDEVDAAVEAVRSAFGSVDLLVNNAGRIESREVPLWETDPEEWWAVVEADLRGPYLFARAVLPEMVARGRGRVVNVTSGAAIRDSAIYSAYGAAKAGLLRLTGSIVAAAGEAGVTAFDISPGHIETDMTRSMEMHQGRTSWTPPEAFTDLVVKVAQGRLDPLSGRYLRAGTDDVEALLPAAAELGRIDARTLRLRSYGPADPLG
ncbi:SDR family NAD(P)-dependent oxidoreductase [Actinopolymorpha pittospori]|uniref:NAD(P)-dependent dehydrogenase (Short-subunit alcohol dehydrogenase family) n=1 Tax=Actinopolymorpha pittospori TaxID=648752 RepID=A0A927RC64_9ACTN|nr:SDR family oxidoreductase [Actinopolymorpha pittospori]MBE1609559.1 NAD(P)-dependent dehydrogenase (short-subunit alcohol dehydrogenase family) [Actinopolymorpha pittospori]